MKTTYIKKLRSGNYELSNRKDYDIKLKTKKQVFDFFNSISDEKTNTWDNFYKTFKRAGVVKARYSRSQTYYTSAQELYDAIK